MSLEAWGDEGPENTWSDKAVEEAKDEAVAEAMEELCRFFFFNISGIVFRELLDVMNAYTKNNPDGIPALQVFTENIKKDFKEL